MKNILTADIGGTNSRFAHFKADDKKNLRLVQSIWLATGDAASFFKLIEQLKSSAFSLSLDAVDISVFAVAGPVENGVFSDPPNIPWAVDISGMAEDFGLKQCLLINDFVAQAFACRSPIMESAREIVPGEIDPSATLAVIGAGTGLGQAALVPDHKGGFTPLPSEGAHAFFPFESERELAYQEFLLKEVGGPYVINDIVVSGRGLSLVHEFLTGQRKTPVQIAGSLSENPETLRWMARFYSRACRNFALHVLARGGVYIAGGVAAKIPTLVTHHEFLNEFRRSKTAAHVLEKIPVFLNQNEESGLWGAALAAVQRL